MSHSFLVRLALVALTFFLTADGLSAQADPEALASGEAMTVVAAAAAEAAHYSMIAAAVRAEGQGWLGTPYRWGGTTRRGIDCSAFVQKLVRATFEIELPRTTATQVHRGVRISRVELRPGDLVFFRRRGVRHVGVYLGGGEFIHASSSRGVTVSTMERGYWNRYYWQSRRILPEFVPPPPPALSVPEPRLVRDEARTAVRALDSAWTVRN